jgi:hypothetical protein
MRTAKRPMRLEDMPGSDACRLIECLPMSATMPHWCLAGSADPGVRNVRSSIMADGDCRAGKAHQLAEGGAPCLGARRERLGRGDGREHVEQRFAWGSKRHGRPGDPPAPAIMRTPERSERPPANSGVEAVPPGPAYTTPGVGVDQAARSCRLAGRAIPAAWKTVPTCPATVVRTVMRLPSFSIVTSCTGRAYI